MKSTKATDRETFETWRCRSVTAGPIGSLMKKVHHGLRRRDNCEKPQVKKRNERMPSSSPLDGSHSTGRDKTVTEYIRQIIKNQEFAPRSK